MGAIPHPIPYQGSKRHLARTIIAYFPEDTQRLVEPFAGSAAVSLAVAYYGKAQAFVLNDLNKALMRLWHEIINEPDSLATAYEELWTAQAGREREFYDLMRERFNCTQRPSYFLYLLARCVKASVRYNANGHFNQSPDNRRRGANPRTMRANIIGASRLLGGRSSLASGDYQEVLAEVTPSDVVYMDPPYQGVCSNRDSRYIAGVRFHSFVEALRSLNARRISFIVSYDGRSGTKRYGRSLPGFLELFHAEVDAGTSSQATLLGRKAKTIESLYFSPALVARLDTAPKARLRYPRSQTPLFERSL